MARLCVCVCGGGGGIMCTVFSTGAGLQTGLKLLRSKKFSPQQTLPMLTPNAFLIMIHVMNNKNSYTQDKTRDSLFVTF